MAFFEKTEKSPDTDSTPVHGTKKAALRAAFSVLKINSDSKSDINPVLARNKILSLMAKTPTAPYKLASVYIGPKEWFVEYYYYDEIKEKYVRDKVRLHGRKLTEAEKRAQLTELCSDINKILRDRNKKGQYHSQFVGRKDSKYDHSQSLAESLEFVRTSGDEDLSADRLACLRETNGIFKSYCNEHPIFATTRITAVDKGFLKLFIKWCKEKMKSGKTINKYLSTIQFASEWLKENKYLTESISTLAQRVSAPKNETGRFTPLTEEEKLRAFAYFEVVDPGYHHMLFWEYYTCIRGSEIYRIRKKDIDFKKRTVKLHWEITKNGLSNHVQIFDPLYDLLIKRGIDKLGPETFIIGAKFQPSKNEYEGPQASSKWANHRKNMGMPKDKQQYAMKHTFVVDYIENNKYNIDWEFLRRHCRHATVQQTQQYASMMSAFFLDETKSIILNYN